MTTRYTIFKDCDNKREETIALKGLSEDTITSVIDYGVIKEKTSHYLLKDKPIPDGLQNEKLIWNGKIIDPCSICNHRLRKVSGNCYSCSFESKKIQTTTPDYTNLLNLLKIEGEKIPTRLCLTVNFPFENYYHEDEISLDEEVILENKEALSQNAKKAAETIRFKKEHCATCVFADEKNNCSHSHPSYCRLKHYYDVESMMKKTLSSIKNKDKLLLLSLICGRTIRYNRVRYRISMVKDEVNEVFLLTRDYSPWSRTTITLDEILEIEPSWKEIVTNEDLLKETSEENQNKHAATLQLIRNNWDTIMRIEKWKNQHMFYATWNPWRNRVDIAIHLSKDIFEYAFNSPVELTKKAIYVSI